MTIVRDVKTLHALYGVPSEAAIIKVVDRLTPEYGAMIAASTFMTLATAGPEGLDCSPRGDRGHVIEIADDRTLLLPDWRGNNRVDSLSNIVRDPRVALLFLIPGSNTTMRVNGSAVLRIDEAMTGRFEMEGRHPRSVIVITIAEVYPQCARAILRADLWNAQHHVDPKTLPTVGDMLAVVKAGFDGRDYDRQWPGRARQSMW